MILRHNCSCQHHWQINVLSTRASILCSARQPAAHGAGLSDGK